jgi:hypothetical protein
VTNAQVNQNVALRVEGVPRRSQGEIRLYLVPKAAVGTVRSRFDSRLSFIGFVRARRNARLTFTVPPLEPGEYELAYWCRGCSGQRRGLALQASPVLDVAAPISAQCPTTPPNGKRPPNAGDFPPSATFHGNGALAVLLRSDGTLVTNSRGGEKMRWWTSGQVFGHLTVDYRMFDSAGRR